jgi:hypothetical protein
MKNLKFASARAVLVLALLCALSTSASAIDVVIAGTSFGGYNYAGSTAKLRIYPSQTFTASDSAIVPGGTQPGATTGFFYIVNCTVASNTLTCPSVTLKSTTDALEGADTTYTVKLFDANGTARDFFPVSDFWLSHTTGPTTTWSTIRQYNNASPRPPASTGYLTSEQTLSAIAANNTVGAPAKAAASPTPLGRVALTVTPADPTLPVAVGANDPRMSAATTSQEGLMSPADKTSLGDMLSQACLPAFGCFDGNATAYGATAYLTSDPATVCATGTDSAPAITNALAAAAAFAQSYFGKATVRLNPGVYCAKRAPQTTNSAYAQIPLPKIAMGTPKIHLTLETKGTPGHAIPFQTPGAGASTMIYSTLTGQTYSGVNGHPCIIGGPDTIHGTTYSFWSWMHFHLRGISFRTAQNPSLCGVNLQNLNDATIEDSRADVDNPTGLPADFGEPTHPTGIAYLMPLTDTDGGDYRGKIQVAGWYGGIGISELTDSSGVLFTYRCRVGLVVQASWFFAPHLKHVIVSRSPYAMAAINPATGVVPIGDEHVLFGTTYRTHMKIDLFALEEEQSLPWALPVALAYDPASKLAGDITVIRSTPNIGQDFGFTQPSHYARNLRFTDLLRPRHQPDYVYGSLAGPAGKALSAFYPQVHQGGKWAAAGGFADLVFASGAATGTAAVVSADVVESGLSDSTVSFNAKPTGAGTAGAVFRYTDTNNYWFVEWVQSTGVATVYEKTAGVVTARTSSTIAVTASKPVVLAVVLSGTSIKVYINGAQVGSTVTSASHQTATKHGIYDFGGGVFYGEFRVTQ